MKPLGEGFSAVGFRILQFAGRPWFASSCCRRAFIRRLRDGACLPPAVRRAWLPRRESSTSAAPRTSNFPLPTNDLEITDPVRTAVGHYVKNCLQGHLSHASAKRIPTALLAAFLRHGVEPDSQALTSSHVRSEDIPSRQSMSFARGGGSSPVVTSQR